jgi:fatty acid desaturase
MPDPALAYRPVTWYRTPIAKADFKKLHEKSDLLGGAQTLGFLALMILPAAGALYSFGRWPIGVTLIFLFFYGMVGTFAINAVHEIGHNTVFRTKRLNAFFVRVFAFLGLINFKMFEESHARHHRYTLHPPDDLEVTLPCRVVLRESILRGIFDPMRAWRNVAVVVRQARGKFVGEWEQTLFPPGSEAHRRAVGWARTMLAGHGLALVVSVYFHAWLVPILVSCGNGCIGGFLQNLCNNTQHIGLQDEVPDFRLNTRTFTLNPFVQFLYWHMNYHIEHHMYAAVPCYRLARLHQLIAHDLPPSPHGLVATWREIAVIQKKQEADPEYQHVALVPVPF